MIEKNLNKITKIFFRLKILQLALVAKEKSAFILLLKFNHL